MKKQIKSVSNWSIKGIITVTILSAMLCTFSAKANNKPSVAINAANVERSENGVESRMNINAETNFEFVEKYNAVEFVQADMAVEIETWANNDVWINNNAVEKYNAAEFVQSDMAIEFDCWLKSNIENSDVTIEAEQYNAAEFVQADMARETESWMNNNGL